MAETWIASRWTYRRGGLYDDVVEAMDPVPLRLIEQVRQLLQTLPVMGHLEVQSVTVPGDHVRATWGGGSFIVSCQRNLEGRLSTVDVTRNGRRQLSLNETEWILVNFVQTLQLPPVFDVVQRTTL